MKYEIGKTYLFVRLESVLNTQEETYRLTTPSIFIATDRGVIDGGYFANTGDVCYRRIENVSFIELTCFDVRKSADSMGSEATYNGYLFRDRTDKIWSIQYPTASYGQLSDRGDFIANRCEEYCTPEELADPEKSKVFDSYELFSNMMRDVYYAINPVNVKDKDNVVTYCYRDSSDFEKILSTIEVNCTMDTRLFFIYLCSIIPKDWRMVFYKKNILKDNSGGDERPFYINIFDFVKIQQ